MFNHKSVFLTVTEILHIKHFQGQFDLDLSSQGHTKYKKVIHNDINGIDFQSQVFNGY